MRCVFGILSRLLFLARKFFICSFILNLLSQDCLDFSLALHNKLKTFVRKFVLWNIIDIDFSNYNCWEKTYP